jgi:aspartate carbamoyltransferase catalytic subunit
LTAAQLHHLLSIADLDRPAIEDLMSLSTSFVEVSSRPIPKVPALRGRTVATVFLEPSTRTRLSFEAAAKRLSADTMTFTAATSSLTKGESLRDTVETLEAMGVDAMVVRHQHAGAPHRVATWVKSAVINGGDGQHEHPTQALLDCYTIGEALELGDWDQLAGRQSGPFDGLSILIVGDIAHSRVARSDVLAFAALGARVTLVGPRTLLPPSTEGWPAEVSHELDPLLADADVVYLLRIQQERLAGALLPSLREYTSTYGLTRERAARLHKDAIVMHPGPMNRGVEIAAEVAGLPRSVIIDQVRNGVAVRMAVLFRLLGGELD